MQTIPNHGFSPDAWLTDIFGYDAYRLHVTPQMLEPETTAARAVASKLADLSPRPFFAYAKVDTGHIAQTHYLEQIGFRLIDTNVTLEKPCAGGSRSPDGPYGFRFATAQDQQGVTRLSSAGFESSRFHLDPQVPDRLANRVKAEWARNYFLGKRGDRMVVAVKADQIVGFNQLLLGADCSLTIDLMAVDRQHRQQGIATGMICYAQRHLPEAKTVYVGTQVANAPSMRLYESLGFRISGSQYVFHHHGPETC